MAHTTSNKSDKPWQIELPAPQWILGVVVTIFILSSLILWDKRFPIFMDEAIFFDMIARFIHGKGLSTELFNIYIPYLDQYSFWYPPVYFLVMAGVYQVLGSSIFIARIFSLCCALGVLALLYWLSKRQLHSHYAATAVICLLVSDPYFQDGAVVARMELLCILTGLGAVASHYYWLETQKPVWNFVSGVLAALSLLTHPTGLILVGPVGLSVVTARFTTWRHKLKELLIFAAPIVLGLGLWMLSFWQQLDIFVLQNAVQMHRKSYGMYFIFQSIQFNPLHRILLLIYIVTNIWFVTQTIVLKQYRSAQIRLLLYLAITSLILTIVLKEMWYVVYLPLISVLLLVECCNYWWSKRFFWLSGILLVVVAVGLMISAEKTTKALQAQDSYTEFGSKIAQHLPANATILLSSMPDPYFYLQAKRPDLHLIESPNAPTHEPIDIAIYNQVLANVEYVVISFNLNSYVAQYFLANQQSIIYRGQPTQGEYPVVIIQLKPVSERQPLVVPDELQWKYPTLP